MVDSATNLPPFIAPRSDLENEKGKDKLATSARIASTGLPKARAGKTTIVIFLI